MESDELQELKISFSLALAQTGALRFGDGLRLKDGRPTPYFVNLGGFSKGRDSYELGKYYATFLLQKGLVEDGEILVGPSYKGSAIAQATSIALYMEYGVNVMFDYDRKESKTHGEATKNSSLFVNNLFFDGCKVILLDDVLTSMATKYELLDKIYWVATQNNININVLSVVIGVDREQTTAVYDQFGNVILNQKGINPVKEFTNKTGIPVYSILRITEVLEVLYKRRVPVKVNGEFRPLDKTTKEMFDHYMSIYGTDRS